jgi:hypothetical protein
MTQQSEPCPVVRLAHRVRRLRPRVVVVVAAAVEGEPALRNLVLKNLAAWVKVIGVEELVAHESCLQTVAGFESVQEAAFLARGLKAAWAVPLSYCSTAAVQGHSVMKPDQE